MKSLIAGLTEAERILLVAVIAGFVSITVALLSAVAAYLATKRDRRRVLYSEAIRAAIAWKEMLYRVRRRQEGQEAELVAQFHQLQDNLSYYQAWVGSESRYLRRSFDALVNGVKRRTEGSITQAWNDPIRPAPGNAVEGDNHPDLSDLVDTFLRDVRSHLSAQPWRRWAMAWRNRKGN